MTSADGLLTKQSRSGSRGKPRRGRLGQKEYIAYLFLAPNIIGFLVFAAGPIVISLILSFCSWDLISPIRFVGVENFRTLLFDDFRFRQAMAHSVYYAVGTIPLDTAGALGLALLLNQKLRGLTFYRTACFLPVITTWVAVAIVWRWLYASHGILNYLLSLIDIDGPRWLSSSTWAMPAIILASVWKGIGYHMIIFLAGLKNIPEELYEAGAIDGCSVWSRFRHITLPLITPSLFFVFIMSTIGALQVFGQVLIMTNGGPGTATRVLILYIYQTAYQWYKMGYASAMAWVFCVIVFAITLIQWRYHGRWVHYQ